MYKTVRIVKPVYCDFHEDVLAYADAKLPFQNNVWSNVCLHCFNANDCELGLGYGQKYLLEEWFEGEE